MLSICWTRITNPRGARRSAFWYVVLIGMMPATAISAESQSSPRRFIPACDLIAYFEFDGLGAHADAWKASATRDMLSKTKAGAMITELVTRWSNWALAAKAGGLVPGADAVALYNHVLQNGFAIGIHGHRTEPLSLIFVLHGIGGAENRERLERVSRVVLARALKPHGELPRPVRIRGREVYEQPDAIRRETDTGKHDSSKPVAAPEPSRQPDWLAARWSAWLEGDNLIVVVTDDAEPGPPDADSRGPTAKVHGKRVSLVFDTIDEKQPNVTMHPGFVAAREQGADLKGFESAGLYFIGPETNKGLLIALSEVSDEPGAVQDVSRATARGERAKSPSPPSAPRHDEIRRAATSMGSPPLVFTEKDRDIINGDPSSARAGAKSGPAAKASSANPASDWWTDAQALGLAAMTRVVGRYGFQGRAFVTDVRVEASAPRKGLLGLLDQPHFRTDQLPPIPPEASTFAVSSLSARPTWQRVLEMATLLDAAESDEVRELQKSMEEPLGAAEELLKCLGPIGAFRCQSRETDRGNRGDTDHAGYALLAGIEDSPAFGRALARFVSAANQSFLKSMSEAPVPPASRKHEQPKLALFKRLPAPDDGYRLNDVWLDALEPDDGIEPVLLIGKTVIVVASDLALAREVLATAGRAGERWRPTGEIANALEGLPSKLTFLAVADHHESQVPGWVEQLPLLAQLLANMSQDDDHEHASAWCILDLLGIPRPGAFDARIDRTKVPAADDVRRFLFPSVVAAAGDDRGYRLILREAFPLALFLNGATINRQIGANLTGEKGLWFGEGLHFDHPLFDLLGPEPTEP